MPNATISRRSIARGAAWAVPAAAVSVAAPAYAASPETTLRLCRIEFGASDVNSIATKFYPGFETTETTIRANTKFTWTITSDKNFGIPDTQDATNANYAWSFNPSTQSTSNYAKITATLTFTRDTPAAEIACPALDDHSLYLSWAQGAAYKMPQGATVTVTSNSPSGATDSVTFVTPRRDSTRKALYFTRKSGKCYPQVWFTGGQMTTNTTCGDGGNSTSIKYPISGCKLSTTGDTTVHMPAICE